MAKWADAAKRIGTAAVLIAGVYATGLLTPAEPILEDSDVARVECSWEIRGALASAGRPYTKLFYDRCCNSLETVDCSEGRFLSRDWFVNEKATVHFGKAIGDCMEKIPPILPVESELRADIAGRVSRLVSHREACSASLIEVGWLSRNGLSVPKKVRKELWFQFPYLPRRIAVVPVVHDPQFKDWVMQTRKLGLVLDVEKEASDKKGLAPRGRAPSDERMNK